MQLSRFHLMLLILLCRSHVEISHHKKASMRKRNVFLMTDENTWYQAGPASESTGTPPSPYDRRWKNRNATILVQIASYRETKCGATLHNLLTKAKNPYRIFFGIVQQNKDEDEDCIEQMCKLFGTPVHKENGKFIKGDCPHFDQVMFIRLKESEAKGPVYARALGIDFIEESKHDFCMQVDAHMDGVKHWDREMLYEWGATKNEYAILTTYPPDPPHMGKKDNGVWLVPHICRADFWMDRVVNLQARSAANLDSPALVPQWAAGLSFSRCHAFTRVPIDIEMKQVFAGEEFAQGSRFWTNGYDFYSPTRPLIGCWYGDKKGGHLGDWKKNDDEEKQAYDRMSTLLQFPGSNQSPEAIASLGKYGMGSKRTYEQYIEFSGIDPPNRKLDTPDKHCIVYYVGWDDTEWKTQYELSKRIEKAADDRLDDYIFDANKKEFGTSKTSPFSSFCIILSICALTMICMFIIFPRIFRFISNYSTYVAKRE